MLLKVVNLQYYYLQEKLVSRLELYILWSTNFYDLQVSLKTLVKQSLVN